MIESLMSRAGKGELYHLFGGDNGHLFGGDTESVKVWRQFGNCLIYRKE